MSKGVTRIVAAAVAALILVAGFSYAATRKASYRSTASLLLAPKKGTNQSTLSSLLDSFQRSGTAGTYVELISSKDTLRRAGVSGVTVSVRSVPDARTIGVETDGAENVVQPALRGIIRATREREPELGDVWQIQVLGSPTPPEVAGISTTSLYAATVLLALLGALFVIVVLRRYRFVATDGSGLPPELASGTAQQAAVGGLPLGSIRPRAEVEQQAEVLVHFDLESFRYVRASATTVLLQVIGYWRSDHPRELPQPTLLLHDGTRMHPLAPLAAPDSGATEAGPETPLWRGSYAAPIEIFERHERIALRAGPGVVVGLPQPIEQGLLAGGERAAASENGAEPEPDTGEFPRDEAEPFADEPGENGAFPAADAPAEHGDERAPDAP